MISIVPMILPVVAESQDAIRAMLDDGQEEYKRIKGRGAKPGAKPGGKRKC